MSFFVPKLYAAPYSSLDTLMNDQMNFFDMKLQGGTKLMVQSYVAICFIIFAPPCRSIPKLTVAQPCIFLENEAFHYSDRI